MICPAGARHRTTRLSDAVRDHAIALVREYYADLPMPVRRLSAQALSSRSPTVGAERFYLRHVLLSYMNYHNVVRTHLSLEKDAPVSRAVERAGRILCRPILGGLHHQYARF